MSDTAERGLVTMELFDLAERMVRQRFRRETPNGSEEAEEEAVLTWLRRRPGAEFGDYEIALARLRPIAS